MFQRSNFGTFMDIIQSQVNPVKGDVSDSTLNAGSGQFETTSEMNEGIKIRIQIFYISILPLAK